MGAGVVADDDLLQPLAQAVLVPAVLRQKLLQGPRRNPRRQGHRLATLGGQFGELAFDVDRKMSPCVPTCKAVVKLAQITSQLRPQLANLIDIHAVTSASNRTPATPKDSSISGNQAIAT
jgi:hypothetical protein